MERAGWTLLGLGAYFIWGLLNGDNIYGLILVPLCLGALVGFLLLGLWLSEKFSGVVVALVYGVALAVLGAVSWLATGEGGVVAFMVAPAGVMGLLFVAAGFAGRGKTRPRVTPDT